MSEHTLSLVSEAEDPNATELPVLEGQKKKGLKKNNETDDTEKGKIVTNPHSWELPEEEYEVVSIPSWNQRKSKSMHLASDETAYEKLFEERVERIVVIDTCGKLKVIEGVEELKQAASLLENAKDEKLEPFWIDIQFPSAKTLECLGEIFGIHNLTIERLLEYG